MQREILVAVARVARSNPSELIGQFSPLAKTTAVESKILIAVARADLILCEVGKILAMVIPAALIGALAALVFEYQRRKRR